jgi:hypothetical protein
MTDPDGEGPITMDISEARHLFPMAEITPDGDLGTERAFDEWLVGGADVAFYRALDGRLLARPARRTHPPSTKLFSDRYDSAELVDVFLNPNPLPAEEEPEDLSEDLDDLPGDEEDDDTDEDDLDDLVDGFTVNWTDEASPWPAVQTLNARRARQFLLTTFKTSGSRHSESAFYDLLLARGYHLAFYARAEHGRRELLCRHYGGPAPRLLPAVPPEVLETSSWGEDWELIATYRGAELFSGDWKEQVSTLSLESFLTVHVSGTGEYGLRTRNKTVELVRIGEDGKQTVTALGRLGPGDDPLTLALQAVPDLLTFDPHTAVDITTDAPHALADTVRLSTDPDRDEMIDLLHEDDLDFFEGEEEELVSYFDNLVPLRLRVNGLLHFAARLDSDWVLFPVQPGSFPAPVLTRTFLSIGYEYDGGGYSSGSGHETIGEIRLGLNVSWGDFREEMWNRTLTLAHGDLAAFAAKHVGRLDFGRRILDSLLRGENASSQTDLNEDDDSDEKWYYNFDDPEIGFQPRSEEGLRFLNTLLEGYPEGSDTAARIRALLNR